MLEGIRRFVLKYPVQVGAAVVAALLTALEIIQGGDPLEMLIRQLLQPFIQG